MCKSHAIIVQLINSWLWVDGLVVNLIYVSLKKSISTFIRIFLVQIKRKNMYAYICISCLIIKSLEEAG